MQKNNIGCALITCNRFDFFKKSLKSLYDASKHYENFEIVVVNDGDEILEISQVELLNTTGKQGVARAKNLGFRHLLNRGCDHIFIMEDDIEIIDSSVFQKYIEASKATGILHLNYGLHGNHNLTSFNTPHVRKTVNYPDGTKINMYSNVLGAFSYYHRSVLEEVGLMDEGYFNALEHVKHTYDIFKAGYTTPWRWFADLYDSEKYLKDIVPDHKQSVIRNENFQEVFQNGLDRFIEQTGFSVVQGYGPPESSMSESECMTFLKSIYKKNQTGS